MTHPHWLRSFRTLVETGGFTRAAQRLGLTQAAVSQHLRHLEDQLGPLLIRRPRQIELTPAGVPLLDYCNELELADASMDSGEISLITPGSVGLPPCPLQFDLQQLRKEICHGNAFRRPVHCG